MPKSLQLLFTTSLFLSPAFALAQGTPEIPAPPPEPETTTTVQPEAAPTPAPAAATPTDTPAPAARTAAPAPAAAPNVSAAPMPTPKRRRGPSRVAVTPRGPTGLYRVVAADSVDPGLIRIGFGLDFFTVGGFFEDEDGHSLVGGTLSVSGSPIEHLELWLNTRAQSSSNDFTNPSLLQSQGDLTLGAKTYYNFDGPMSLGLDLSLGFLSGIGSAAFDFGATRFQARALFSGDLTKAKTPIPLRAHLNIGFVVDNSNNLLDAVGVQLTNAERFALSVSDFNRFAVGLGIEAPVKYVTPYLEYTVELPLSYLATPGVVLRSNALRTAQVDPADAPDIFRPAIQRVIPQRITPGIRITAIPKLTIDLAVEIGLTPDVATGVLAVPPYSVAMFASYPLDPFSTASNETAGPPISVPVIVPETVAPAPSTGKVVGFVKDKSTNAPLAGAVINFDRSPPVASASDGSFESHEIEPGPVKVSVSKDGFKTGSVDLDVLVADAAELEVVLVPEIREGTIRGRVLDDKDQPLSGVSVRIEGPTKKTLTTGADGAFETTATEGQYLVSAEHPEFLKKGRELKLEGGATYSSDILIRKRPKEKIAEIKGDRIILRRSVHFVTGEARLAPDAAAILDNVVDVIVANPAVRKLRIEGHTDNVGGMDNNMKLSRERAQAVVDYLVKEGVDAKRLVSEGFGPNRPIAPNLTRRGREQNRRVEFHIVEQ